MNDVVIEQWPMTSLEEAFLPELQLEVPELPDDVLLFYARKAAIEFCQRTNLVQRDIDIFTEPGITNYLLESPDCTFVLMIAGVFGGDGEPFKRISTSATKVPWLRNVVWWDRVYNELRFSRPPEKRHITVRVSVAPKDDALDIDTVLTTRYREAVLKKTLALLYAIPRRAWSNPSFAAAYERDFETAVSCAGTDRLTGGMQGTIPVKGFFHI